MKMYCKKDPICEIQCWDCDQHSQLEKRNDFLSNMKKIRNYFIENDKSPFEQWAYTFINKFIENNIYDYEVIMLEIDQVKINENMINLSYKGIHSSKIPLMIEKDYVYELLHDSNLYDYVLVNGLKSVKFVFQLNNNSYQLKKITK